MSDNIPLTREEMVIRRASLLSWVANIDAGARQSKDPRDDYFSKDPVNYYFGWRGSRSDCPPGSLASWRQNLIAEIAILEARLRSKG